MNGKNQNFKGLFLSISIDHYLEFTIYFFLTADFRVSCPEFGAEDFRVVPPSPEAFFFLLLSRFNKSFLIGKIKIAK